MMGNGDCWQRQAKIASHLNSCSRSYFEHTLLRHQGTAMRLTAIVGILFVCLFFTLGQTRSETDGVVKAARRDEVDFEQQIQGLLGRMGCNAGACHGSFQGKGGLYLSLFGYSAEKDYHALTRDGSGRRINLQSPDESLLLLKATNKVPHGGGARFTVSSREYQLFRRWIAEGAKWEPGSGQVRSLTTDPAVLSFSKAGQKQSIRLFANFTNGSKGDVTPLCDFRIADDYIAQVDSDGIVEAMRPGDTVVIASYRGNIHTVRVFVPNALPANFTYPALREANYIDQHVNRKLASLNILPSENASDAEFLRRVYIDTIGCLPEPEQVRNFLNDVDPHKRDKLIDDLLEHPLHSALWALKFSDITGNNVDVMEQPQQLRPKLSRMWYDWFRKRLQENMPYDQIVQGVLTASSRNNLETDDWVKMELERFDLAQKGFEHKYAERPTLDLFWRRNGFTPELRGEQVAAAFLGVRLECAQCHKHPFDRWTQGDYRAFANIFSQVQFGISKEAKPAVDKANQQLRDAVKEPRNRQVPQLREVYVDPNQRRTLPDPDTNRPLPPQVLGGPQLKSQGDVREQLLTWMRRPDNPYFARSFVNRVWGHYFGRGLVEPVDDFSVANPPTHPELLEALAKDFVRSGYDIRHLERRILSSFAYQRSVRSNDTNLHDRKNYARSYTRRLMAEQVVDVLNSALGVTENLGPDVPPGSKAIEIAQNRVANGNLAYIFRIFGRPPRTSACDCERASEPALPQTLFLMTDQQLLNKITTGRLRKLMAQKKTDAEILEEIFLATLTRYPTKDEKTQTLDYIRSKTNRTTALTDVVWALVNTREFILNH